jgi:hypothetical protein
MLVKQDGKKRTIITQSLYNLLGQNIFHKGMSTFAHDFAEDIQVGFYELGFKTNTWVLQEANKLMFGERKKSSSTIEKDHYVDMFTKMLGYHGNKLFYISKQEHNKDNMIAMVIFAVLKKEDKTECLYIL